MLLEFAAAAIIDATIFMFIFGGAAFYKLLTWNPVNG